MFAEKHSYVFHDSLSLLSIGSSGGFGLFFDPFGRPGPRRTGIGSSGMEWIGLLMVLSGMGVAPMVAGFGFGLAATSTIRTSPGSFGKPLALVSAPRSI